MALSKIDIAVSWTATELQVVSLADREESGKPIVLVAWSRDEHPGIQAVVKMLVEAGVEHPDDQHAVIEALTDRGVWSW